MEASTYDDLRAQLNALKSPKRAHMEKKAFTPHPEDGMPQLLVDPMSGQPYILDPETNQPMPASPEQLQEMGIDPAMFMGGDPQGGGMPPEAAGGGAPPMEGQPPMGGQPPQEGGGSIEDVVMQLAQALEQQQGQIEQLMGGMDQIMQAIESGADPTPPQMGGGMPQGGGPAGPQAPNIGQGGMMG